MLLTNFVRKPFAVAGQRYAIKGNGITSGNPAYFLLLAGCNLLGPSTDHKVKSFEQLVTDFGGETFVKNVKRGAHIFIAGGEPLLQQEAITQFHQLFIQTYGVYPTIEVETNGTIEPDWHLKAIVGRWNVVPRLKSSGYAWKDRFKYKALLSFEQIEDTPVTFNFIIEHPRDDWSEVYEKYFPLISRKKTILVPAFDDVHELVMDICKANVLRFSNRLQYVDDVN